eukprot:CAMPEP_0113494012 /NCGR_PEP_ID=MMETSP0014_2-20120614/28888_1 /TAXON_ID=2857 /ORGANISM="Nitzschia sp." /LENGTH=342 /DNA_ID=CAMNT_0000387893 /DNA_START=109 /DNA_END=1137 /DNA_ORIENTATION=+ /assembly_acc=CAM_ASM_000159
MSVTMMRKSTGFLLLVAVAAAAATLMMCTNVACYSVNNVKSKGQRTSLTSSSSTRRSFLRDVAIAVPAAAIIGPSLAIIKPSIVSAAADDTAVVVEDKKPSSASTKTKVLVLGGTGFVGSRVVSKLQSLGNIEVIATSRDGRDGTVAFDVLKEGDNEKRVQELAKGCSAVISCIGAIGTSDDVNVVNAASGYAAKGAKAVGVDKFVYISVSPEVKRSTEGISQLQNYMKGKTFSEQSILSTFSGPGQACLIEPTFIFGGDEFSVNPPRVAGFYGNFIESLLGSGPIRAVTNVLPEGFIRIALEPPISVDDVANAAVSAALGKSTVTELDTHDKIVDAAAKLS